MVQRTSVRIAVSDCLVGSKVRWDGSDYGETVPEALRADWVELIGICPEIGIGMGVPREPIRLVATKRGIRALDVATSSRDWTTELQDFHLSIRSVLSSVNGYIFTERSPSCGLKGVKLYREEGDEYVRSGVGIHAGAVRRAYPTLPVIEAHEIWNNEETLKRFLAAAVRHSKGALTRPELDQIP